ncbi:OLC1v1023243C1 [Oldenlandia corymbosa var. corymbosa]|uniref:OLC1v1023243C1 n=1 Tax=Oldenlandia corymbosa var. corymbosa TaxID=529605 RepID=A0AAV1C0D7_OLDCO|nr:OLC1v1023243C1 [Oldenlandia corymbosa var. corymbosa]
MALVSSLPSFFLLLPLLLILHQPLLSSANLYETKALFRSVDFSSKEDASNANEFISTSSNATLPPTRFFEVTKPIELPKTRPFTYLILQHDFGSTYGKPPVFANYTPPTNFQSQRFEKIVLEWTATCKGRQFDRIFGVWLSGVEILRSCTAEPRPNGIVWTVQKDITRYYSLLMSNQTMAVYLQNIIDSTYTGVYHVNVSIHFYPAEEKHDLGGGLNVDDSVIEFSSEAADLILPISRDLPLNDGLWFEIQNSTDVQTKQFKIPQNVYRAVLEVYVSYHENDEFWYTNLYNDYIALNKLSGVPGNGPFREVVVSLDGVVAGSVWPFPVVYTGGINPLLWRPISGIGSFDLPSFNIEITPYLGNLLDAKTHAFVFSVTNALNVWYIDANLHLWIDKKSAKTEGKLKEHETPPLTISTLSNIKGTDASFSSHISRIITSSGWVKSSYGTVTTKSIQVLNYTNFMVVGNEGNMQIVNQTIDYNDKVTVKMPSSSQMSFASLKNFPLYLYTDSVDQKNGTYNSVSNISRAFNEKKKLITDHGVAASSLRNLQQGESTMLVKGNLVLSGLGSTRQVYKYDDNKFCYLRNISSSNYTILHDKVRDSCSRKVQKLHLTNGLGHHLI